MPSKDWSMTVKIVHRVKGQIYKYTLCSLNIQTPKMTAGNKKETLNWGLGAVKDLRHLARGLLFISS